MTEPSRPLSEIIVDIDASERGSAERRSLIFSALERSHEAMFSTSDVGGAVLLTARLDDDAVSAVLSKDGALDLAAQLIRAARGKRIAEEGLAGRSAREIIDRLSRFVSPAGQIDWVLERHIVYEIQQRIELDVGKAIVDKAPSPFIAIDRLREMREYIEEKVSAAFRSHRESARPFDAPSATRLVLGVVQETFRVFEEYIK